MNVKQLIEKYKKLEGVWDAEGAEIARQIFLQDLEQLDEPEKVKIPQMVADWIEKCKTFKHFAVSLSFALQPIVWEKNNLSDKCIDWLMDANNQETFARAWLDGYEVEKEPKYIVKIKGVGFMSFLNHDLQSDLWSINNVDNGKIFKTHHTRKELEDAGFGWVFDCEGIEVEEVE